jgi:hypothetical protein
LPLATVTVDDPAQRVERGAVEVVVEALRVCGVGEEQREGE